jgi:drug/metabolite transporter (DMT)-like permease
MTISRLDWALIIFGILSGAVGGVFFKMGARAISYEQPIAAIVWSTATNIWIVLALALYFLPFIIWTFLLKHMDLSQLQPMFSLVYVVTTVFAVIILGEHVSTYRWLGVGLILAGVLVVSRN